MHEAGAIECTGHKVMTLPSYQGKMKAEDLRNLLESFWKDASYEHMVFPGMVYLSYPTEYGTLYSKAELQAIAEVCREYQIPLYLDGARLGYGLMSRECDLTISVIADLCDVFYQKEYAEAFYDDGKAARRPFGEGKTFGNPV